MTKRVLRFGLVLFVALLLLTPAVIYAQDEPPEKTGAAEGPSICQPVSPGDNPGPDTFGYVYRDDELDPGEWVDISGTGTEITGSVLENLCTQVNIGFTFYYYGSPKTQVYVCADGYLRFGGTGGSDWTVDCPVVNANDPDDAIYAFWTDLDAEPGNGGFGGGSVYYQTLGSSPNRTFVVEFEDVQYWDSEEEATFEVILFETSGDILVQFLDVPSPPYYSTYGAAIGIENSVGDDGLTYACNVSDMVEDEMNVLFRYNFDLGDWVWYDTNHNGLQDAGEPGVGGIHVDLYYTDDCSGQWVDDTNTDANGDYLFPYLLAGTYCLEFGIPAGWDITLQNAGLDGIDSDANPTTGRITNINLDTRYDDLDQDMGLYKVVIEEEEEEFVPEWGSVALLGSGLAGLAGYATLRWRRR